MQKDGTHRVVYGTQLKDITGKVKMVAVGYGREAEDGTQTLGGRSVDALSTINPSFRGRMSQYKKLPLNTK
jgi:hypothetical protein